MGANVSQNVNTAVTDVTKIAMDSIINDTSLNQKIITTATAESITKIGSVSGCNITSTNNASATLVLMANSTEEIESTVKKELTEKLTSIAENETEQDLSGLSLATFNISLNKTEIAQISKAITETNIKNVINKTLSVDTSSTAKKVFVINSCENSTINLFNTADSGSQVTTMTNTISKTITDNIMKTEAMVDISNKTEQTLEGVDFDGLLMMILLPIIVVLFLIGCGFIYILRDFIKKLGRGVIVGLIGVILVTLVAEFNPTDNPVPFWLGCALVVLGFGYTAIYGYYLYTHPEAVAKGGISRVMKDLKVPKEQRDIIQNALDGTMPPPEDIKKIQDMLTGSLSDDQKKDLGEFLKKSKLGKENNTKVKSLLAL